MTPAEIKSLRHALGLSAEGFARAFGIASGRTVRRWEASGDAQSSDIPGPVAVLCDLAVKIPAVAAEIKRRGGAL